MTKIAWADKAWNPVTGCSPISEGCQNCYAARMSKRLRGRFGYPADDPFRVTFHLNKIGQPLKWKKPRRIFVCSMGDLFHNEVLDSWQFSIFKMIARTPRHTYLALTKRPYNMQDFIAQWVDEGRQIPDNLWLGVTVENQKCADDRIPVLLGIPAAVRFVSVEPCLEKVNLKLRGYAVSGSIHSTRRIFLRWVIIGCESGPKRRPCNIEWVRDLVEQCKEAGVPVFVKQLNLSGKVEHDINKFPKDLQIREYPTDFFEKMGTVKCPKCGDEVLFDTDNDTILCDECDAMLLISYDDEHGYEACVV